MKAGVHFRRVFEHVWGPGGSVALHVVIIIVLCRLISVPRPPEADDALVVDIITMPENPPPPDWQKELDDVVVTEMDVAYQPLPPQPESPTPPDIASEMISPVQNNSPLIILMDNQAFAPLSSTFGERSSEGIGRCLSQYSEGYGALTEPAVIRALKWLSEHQNPNGSWGPGRLDRPAEQKFAVGLTGLAVLTFLAHGETPQSGDYRTSVRRGIEFLVNQQDAVGGSFSPFSNAPGNEDYAPYAHAIATYAISEAYGLTRISHLKPVMEKAVTPIINGQMPGGGWGYGYCNARGARRDLSVMGWQIQALKAAAISGAEAPGLYTALSNAVRAVGAMQLPNGRFVYSATGAGLIGSGTDSMTGVGVLCMQLLGYGRHMEARAGLRALKDVSCDWDEALWGGGLHDTRTYDYYYITQAKFQEGKTAWRQWNRRVATELVNAQHEEGFWLGPASEESITHKVYNTTLAALTLQVYYRFLPTYKPIAPREEISQSDDDDIRIEVI